MNENIDVMICEYNPLFIKVQIINVLIYKFSGWVIFTL